jgi:hypothetical protein
MAYGWTRDYKQVINGTLTRRWTRARGLLLLPMLQTLSHRRLRERNLLRRGTGRCFCVSSVENPLFYALARCGFKSVLLR